MWPDRDRVAELIVTRADGRSRGSGYRIDATQVLTAAHVVENAESVSVRFSPDLPSEQTVSAVSWQADPVSDIAHVRIPPQSGEAVQFGRVGTSAAVLQAQAVGFPLWKMRDGQYRDSHHAVGTVAVLSNFREGTLEFVVPSPPAAVEGRSPWEGMSGAALWVDGRIVGVVSKHHPGDGLGRLAVAPLTGDFPDVITQPGRYDALLADIAPDELVGRSQELAELVSFCAGDEPYMWWQAGPWAGKTALMSWFALHPPAGVDVVSFFITAGQSDSGTFIESVIEQLDEAASANRANLLRLLRKAAERSVANGRRLLVVVDGLDEDTSKQTAVRPSIASLLPRRVPPGMRVLVSGRPNPDLPDDVPGDHPLRALTARRLEASSRARHIEIAARNELSQLLQGEPLYREILGLLAACGSGLTVNDLEELTGQPRYELERVFSSAFARSLTSRRHVYLFAHKTLRETAEARYGTSLERYRERLHRWAQSYAECEWPENTPDYLVAGYPEMLATTGQVRHLTGLAADRARHDWLLGVTWGDAQALREIQIASSMSGGDLATLLKLALARSDLQQRNRALPVELPATWVRLGELARARALADSITEPDERAMAFQGMIAAAPDRTEQWFAELLAAVDAAVAAIGKMPLRVQALGGLAGVLASVGEHEHALRLIDQAEAAGCTGWESLLAAPAAAAGDHDRALRLTRAVPDAQLRAETTVAIAGLLPADVGRELIREVRAGIAGTGRHRLIDLARLAEPMAALGDRAGFAELAAEIEDLIREETQGVQCDVMVILSAGAAALGEIDRAKQYFQAAQVSVGRITAPDERVSMLGRLLKTAVAAGDGYERLAAQAEAAVREIDDDRARVRRLMRLAPAVRDAGDSERCTELVAQIAQLAERLFEPWSRARVWNELAGLMDGHPAKAREFAVKAERTARLMPVGLPEGALADLIGAAAITGDRRRASRLAGRIPNVRTRAFVLAHAAAAVADAELAAQAEQELFAGELPGGLLALCEVMRAVAAIGDTRWYAALHAKAEAMAGPHYRGRGEGLGLFARAAADAGDRERTIRLASDAESQVRRDPLHYQRTALGPVIEALATIGDFDEALRIARILVDETQVVVVRSLVASGQDDRATEVAQHIRTPAERAEALAVLAAAGRHSLAVQAENTAREIDDYNLRWGALARLADALSTTRHFDDMTRRLITEVLAGPAWHQVLTAAARLDPQAVRDLCDEVLARRD